MKLSLVIPEYNTSNELAKPLFDSIQKQEDFDFNELEIIVVDDASTIPFDLKFFDAYEKLNVKFIKSEKNMGSGVARQIGINQASGEYLLFADIDDEFANNKVLARWLLSIEKNPDANIFVSTFLEEIGRNKDNKEVLVPHTNDCTWMHGKLYKASFIKENGVAFHKDLRFTEDTFFNTLAWGMCEDDKLLYTADITYIWKRNNNSITRNNNADYTYSKFKCFIDSVDKAIYELYLRDKPIVERCIQAIIYVYYTLQADGWLEHRKEKRIVERDLARFYEKYKDAFNHIDRKALLDKFYSERIRIYQINPFLERETFDQFITRIKRLGK